MSIHNAASSSESNKLTMRASFEYELISSKRAAFSVSETTPLPLTEFKIDSLLMYPQAPKGILTVSNSLESRMVALSLGSSSALQLYFPVPIWSTKSLCSASPFKYVRNLLPAYHLWTECMMAAWLSESIVMFPGGIHKSHIVSTASFIVISFSIDFLNYFYIRIVGFSLKFNKGYLSILIFEFAPKRH